MSARLQCPYVVCIAHHPIPDLIGRKVRLLPGQDLSLGRGGLALGPDALMDPRMSRKHAVLHATDDALKIEDLGSRNGTLVDGHPVQHARLGPGAVVGLGRVLLQVWREPTDGTCSLEPSHSLPLITDSPAMWSVREAVARLAEGHTHLAVMGEDGAGKSTVAQAVHRASGRSPGMVTLPVAALPEDRVQHALHGHDADRTPSGALARAHGSTLLLPRIDAALPIVHHAVLQFLQDGMLRPVGGRPRPVDVRVVVTSVRDLSTAADAGDLLPALWAALADGAISVPPLRERREDILPIARFLATGHAGRIVHLDRLLALLLVLHDWPGNVGELDQVIARIVTEQTGPEHPDTTTLLLPAWGPETFGPEAASGVSTFDPLRLDPQPGSP